MEYTHTPGDADAVLAFLAPFFNNQPDPMQVAMALWSEPAWKLLRPDLSRAVEDLLYLELDDDERRAGAVILRSAPVFGAPVDVPAMPSPELHALWRELLDQPLPLALEGVLRDSLLSSGADRTPDNASRLVEVYRSIAAAAPVELHSAFAMLRANTIAKSRSMAEEATIRVDLLDLARRAVHENAPPGITTRYLEALTIDPRSVARHANEKVGVAQLLEEVESVHGDPSTADMIATCRIALANDEAEREVAKRRHVEAYLATAKEEGTGFLRMHWAERAAELAQTYELRDLHDVAIVFMQRIPPDAMGWTAVRTPFELPRAVELLHARRTARLNSWEKAVSVFLGSRSPAGSYEVNLDSAQRAGSGILRFATRRTFGVHGLPERTGADFVDDELRRIEQYNLLAAGMALSIELAASARRFGIPEEKDLAAWLAASYDCRPTVTMPYAQALRLYWFGDPSGSARITIPLIETCARELLLMCDEPLYRRERGASPGRFPAMDFYLDALDRLGLDIDWSRAFRTTLLNPGMNLRNLYAHGFRLDFSREEAAVLLRLAGMFIALPLSSDALDDEVLSDPLARARGRLRRRLRWVWE